MKRSFPLVLAAFFFSVPALAQDDQSSSPAATAPATTATAATEEPKEPSKGRFALGIERFGGISYAKASESEGDDSVSLLTMGLGVGTINPYAVPRLGVDYILENGLSLGAGAGFTRWSGSASSGSRSEDIGSIFLYTLTPRVGYRIPLSRSVDMIPRAGLTLAGGSTNGGGSGASSASVFSLGAGIEAPFAARITDSFHLLFAPAFDVTLTASVSQSSSNGTTTSSTSEDLKATLWALQAWVGVGGYL